MTATPPELEPVAALGRRRLGSAEPRRRIAARRQHGQRDQRDGRPDGGHAPIAELSGTCPAPGTMWQELSGSGRSCHSWPGRRLVMIGACDPTNATISSTGTAGASTRWLARPRRRHRRRARRPARVPGLDGARGRPPSRRRRDDGEHSLAPAARGGRRRDPRLRRERRSPARCATTARSSRRWR